MNKDKATVVFLISSILSLLELVFIGFGILFLITLIFVFLSGNDILNEGE